MISILITGPPRIGKTTILMRVINELKNRGFKISGIICPEVRDRGDRVGFKIIDLYTGEWGWLARLRDRVVRCEIEFGRYCIDVESINSIINRSLQSLSIADILCVDEIGPMELKSRDFDSYINKIFSTKKPLLVVVHRKLVDTTISKLKFMGRNMIKLYRVNYSNRDKLHMEIIDIILNNLK